MIRFRCRCGNLLEAPQSAAGGDVQCPRCGVLQSVPQAHELTALTEEGLFRFADEPGATPVRTWQPHTAPPRGIDIPSHVDPRGIDRHQPLEDILRIGAPRDDRPPRPPRYDPETGELIREFELAGDADWRMRQPIAPPQPPIAQLEATLPTQAPQETGPPQRPALAEPPPTLPYAAGKQDYARLVAGEPPIPLNVRPVYWHTIPLEMFLQPANALVVGFVFGLHLLGQLFSVLTLMGGIPLILLAGWIWLILLAHYITVIDETGPERRDELPSVMRNISPGDDFLAPLRALLLAFLICFGPAAIVCYQQMRWAFDSLFYGFPGGGLASLPRTPALPLGIALAMAGFLFFPAALLTAATSGVITNLLPHRIFGVVRAAPAKYLVSLLVLAAAAVSYPIALGAMGFISLALAGWTTPSTKASMIAAAIGYPMLFAAIYFTHWFTWLLGKIHQEHHDHFGWVWQRHISRRQDATKQLERMKAAQIMAERDESLRRAQQHMADAHIPPSARRL